MAPATFDWLFAREREIVRHRNRRILAAATRRARRLAHEPRLKRQLSPLGAAHLN